MCHRQSPPPKSIIARSNPNVWPQSLTPTPNSKIQTPPPNLSMHSLQASGATFFSPSTSLSLGRHVPGGGGSHKPSHVEGAVGRGQDRAPAPKARAQLSSAGGAAGGARGSAPLRDNPSDQVGRRHVELRIPHSCSPSWAWSGELERVHRSCRNPAAGGGVTDAVGGNLDPCDRGQLLVLPLLDHDGVPCRAETSSNSVAHPCAKRPMEHKVCSKSRMGALSLTGGHRQVEGGDRRGDVEWHAVVLGQHREHVGSDLCNRFAREAPQLRLAAEGSLGVCGQRAAHFVGGVAVQADAVSPSHHRVDLPCGHQAGRHRVADQRAGQTVRHLRPATKPLFC